VNFDETSSSIHDFEQMYQIKFIIRSDQQIKMREKNTLVIQGNQQQQTREGHTLVPLQTILNQNTSPFRELSISNKNQNDLDYMVQTTQILRESRMIEQGFHSLIFNQTLQRIIMNFQLNPETEDKIIALENRTLSYYT